MDAIAWILASAVGGFIGNRSDWISCDAIKRVHSALIRPTNHDIAKALSKTVFQSIKFFLSDFRNANPFPSLTEVLDECEEAIRWTDPMSDRPSSSTEKLIELLYESLTPILAEDFTTKRRDIEEAIVDGLIGWLALRSQESLPDLFVSAIRKGLVIGNRRIDPWINTFRTQLSNEIKENARFREIVFAQLLAGTSENVKDMVEKLASFEEKLSYLTQMHVSIDWDRILVTESSKIELLFDDACINIAEPATMHLTRIKLGTKFKYLVSCNTARADYFVLQEAEGDWYVTSLNEARTRIAQAEHGDLEIPRDDWLVERNEAHIGRRRVGVVMSAASIPKEIREILTVREKLEPSEVNRIAQFAKTNQGVWVWFAEYHVCK